VGGVGCGATGCGGGGAVGDQHRVAYLDLLAALEQGRLDALPVHEGAVARTEVVESGAAVWEHAQGRVAARRLAVREHEVDARLAADRELRPLDPDGPTGAGS
jgi:hypothetical protein